MSHNPPRCKASGMIEGKKYVGYGGMFSTFPNTIRIRKGKWLYTQYGIAVFPTDSYPNEYFVLHESELKGLLGMNFIDAIKEMKDGKKVQRVDWNPRLYLFIDKDGNIKVHYSNDDINIYGFPIAEISTGDWQIVQDKPPIEVKLNDEYFAEVTDKEVVVGCQTVSIDKIKEVLKAAEQYGASNV